MATGRIKTLIDEYEELLTTKNRLAKETEENKGALKAKADELAQAISDADMANVQDGDYTYTPGLQHKYYLISDSDAEEAGIDRFAPFENDAAFTGLVRKEINWRRLQSAMQEIEDTEEGIPEEVMAVLNIQDEYGISRRKTDTKTKNKVAEGLKKRRNGNVE